MGRHFVVSFREIPISLLDERRSEGSRRNQKLKVRPNSERSTAIIQALRRELDATKDYLTSIVHEYESRTEELQSANEEILSSNEELQSINEELETAKEVLQSTNEELTTVNTELYQKNTELNHAINEINHLPAGVSLPIIIMGKDLRVRRQTPKAEELLNIRQSDVGCSISDIRLELSIPRLDRLILKCIEAESVNDRMLRNNSDRSFNLRVSPYRTTENEIDGTVQLFTENHDRLKGS